MCMCASFAMAALLERILRDFCRRNGPHYDFFKVALSIRPGLAIFPDRQPVALC